MSQWKAALGTASLLFAAAAPAVAQTQPQEPAKSEWSFAFTPYVWAMGIDGSLTAKGMTANVSANIIDLLGETNTLYGFMGNFEARKREYSLYVDAVYTYTSGSGGASLQRTPFPRVNVSANANVNFFSSLFILEGGFGYELYRGNPVSTTGEANSGGWTSAIDAIVGVRYWHARTDVSVGVNIDVSRTAPLISFDASRSVAAAGTGNLDWADPFIGLRLRQRFAPHHGIDVEGDVGGFGVGSQFTW